MQDLRTYTSTDQMATESAAFIAERARSAIEENDRFSIALSGSFTALDTYRLLPQAFANAGVDLMKVFIFWSEERCVPPSHPDNHYRMAQTNFLDHVAIPAGNIHPIHCEQDPKQEAMRYEEFLRTHFQEQGAAAFDLVLLGLGKAGQVASIFPGSESIEEAQRWVVADFIEPLGEWRVTMTPNAINDAKGVMFLVRGKVKSEAVRKAFQDGKPDRQWPAQWIEPSDGDVVWFLDEAAAILLRD
jgi:6-phosphogluconolactonase